MDIPMEALLPYASFALAVAGLVVRIFLAPESRKAAMLVIVLTLLVVMTGVGSYRVYLHEEQVEAISEKIITKLGTNMKTLEEIYEDLLQADPAVTSEALERLIDARRVDHKILDVRDDLGTRFRARGYFVTEAGKGQP
jgi:hypothetical protein